MHHAHWLLVLSETGMMFAWLSLFVVVADIGICLLEKIFLIKRIKIEKTSTWQASQEVTACPQTLFT